MPTQRPQRPRPARHFAPPLLDADSNFRGVMGLGFSSAWIVSVRPTQRQGMDRLHARNWGYR